MAYLHSVACPCCLWQVADVSPGLELGKDLGAAAVNRELRRERPHVDHADMNMFAKPAIEKARNLGVVCAMDF